LRPVTIKQLLDAHHPHPDADHFMIDDSETTQVTFVGQVRNISAQTTNVTYKLDDGTGIIEVKVWVDAEANEDEYGSGKKQVVEQGYARVWGRVKQFNNKRHVGAQFIRPIEDYNELAYHLLEATVVHLHFSKGPLEQVQANGGAQGQIGNGAANAYGGGQAMAGGGGGGADVAGLSPPARKVFGCLKATPQTNEGLHAQVIAQQTGLELSDVYKAGDELMGMGKIYTTVDDLTWALLDL
jgi:replication factor A2